MGFWGWDAATPARSRRPPAACAASRPARRKIERMRETASEPGRRPCCPRGRSSCPTRTRSRSSGSARGRRTARKRRRRRSAMARRSASGKSGFLPLSELAGAARGPRCAGPSGGCSTPSRVLSGLLFSPSTVPKSTCSSCGSRPARYSANHFRAVRNSSSHVVALPEVDHVGRAVHLEVLGAGRGHGGEVAGGVAGGAVLLAHDEGLRLEAPVLGIEHHQRALAFLRQASDR